MLPLADKRFWSKVDKSAGGCWLWTGYTNPAGYGRICRRENGKDKCHLAHRYAWTQLVGPIEDGMTLDHLCRVRACVNPEHLEVVTQKVNVRRGNAPTIVTWRTGTCKRGHSMADAHDTKKGKRCRRCQQIAAKKHRDNRK